MESNDVRAIGICGMGGIGKTTTAQAFYNKYSNKFDISCFIENVKYSEEGSPLLSLLNQVLIKLFRRKDYKVPDVENGIRILKNNLFSKKALIVLDDLVQSSHSELLVRLGNLFSTGSRIIITTRDANLLNQLEVYISKVDIYMVRVLGHSDSLKLFSYKAFGKPMPPENFRELAVGFVTYAGGLPLALKLLGSSLRGRTDLAFWKAKLAKLCEIPNKGIQKILQLSYDELEDKTEKSIFLYIAFFFIGKVKDEAVHIFNSCKFFPDSGIPILVERCLLTIDEDDKFRMHNLIQGMGRELGRSKGLFWRGAPGDMHNIEGRNKIEGLILDMSMQGQIAPEIFDKLSNLRILEINDAQDMKGNFTNVFPELRSIRWRGSPVTHLSSSFLPRKLVSLDVSSSKLKTLWKSPRAIKQLTYLGHLNLARCYNLKRLPEQLGDLKGLRMLDASHTAIEKLPDSISHLKELVQLRLEGCRKLRELPKNFGNMEGLETLDATYTAIRKLPDSFTGLFNLVKLRLYGCKKLGKLPEQFGNMKGLRMLDASFSAIAQLPESFGMLINLVDLQLSDCKNLTSISNSVWKLKFLRVLNVKYCSMLERLPEQLGMMKSLIRLDANGSAIDELPDSIGLLSNLQELHVNNKLKYVPTSIWNLTSLTELSLNQKDNFKIDLPDTVRNMKLEELSLRCNIRLWLPTIQSFSCLQKLTLIDDGQSVSSTIPFSLTKLYNLRDLTLVSLTSFGSSFPELPLDLKYLNIYKHKTLQKLPDFSGLKQLTKLDIWKCFSLQSLPPLPPHLQILQVRDCTNLQSVPDLSMLKELETPTFTGCSKLKVTNLIETSTEVRPYLSSSKDDLPNGELAEWFSYACSGSVVSFDTPPIVGDNILLDALFVYYTSSKSRDATYYTIKAVITNKTQGIEYKYYIDVPSSIVIARSTVKSIIGKDISLTSGDILHVLFQGSGEEVNVKTCGIYMIHRTPSPSASCY
ncbi:uncharacterized protein LOC141721305 [Apium graveolens]|uniref:uncharacterized protein LOC141721305 n=1 Tax=Apium graveolens TaxID=4045 RepID=UPI003D792C55